MGEDPTPPLRVASYNIRAGLGTDLRRDGMRVIEAIRALDADIVALQEADHRLGPRPSALPRAEIAVRTGLVPVPVGRGQSLGWHGNAMLARPGLIPVAVLPLDLPGLEPRGALVVDFDAGRPLRVVAVHLGLLRRSRRRQIDALRARLSTLAPMPTVILGDFNEWSRRVGLGRLARDYAIVTPGPSFPSTAPFGALDRFAHCPRLTVAPVEVARRRGAQPSDHLPVMAEVRPV